MLHAYTSGLGAHHLRGLEARARVNTQDQTAAAQHRCMFSLFHARRSLVFYFDKYGTRNISYLVRGFTLGIVKQKMYLCTACV